jgi:hypothetical protein
VAGAATTGWQARLLKAGRHGYYSAAHSGRHGYYWLTGTAATRQHAAAGTASTNWQARTSCCMLQRREKERDSLWVCCSPSMGARAGQAAVAAMPHANQPPRGLIEARVCAPCCPSNTARRIAGPSPRSLREVPRMHVRVPHAHAIHVRGRQAAAAHAEEAERENEW